MNKKILTVAALAGLAPVFTSAAQAQNRSAPQQWEYCTSGVNSTGLVGVTYMIGSLGVSENDTWLLSYNCPPDEWGVFLMGETSARYPFGDGFLCISPYDTPIYRMGPPQMSNFMGISQRYLDFTDYPFPGMSWQVGSPLYFQCYFRDRAGAGAGFNLSSGVAVVFVP